MIIGMTILPKGRSFNPHFIVSVLKKKKVCKEFLHGLKLSELAKMRSIKVKVGTLIQV